VGTLPATAANSRAPGTRRSWRRCRRPARTPSSPTWRAPIPSHVPGRLRRLRPCFRPRHRRLARASLIGLFGSGAGAVAYFWKV